MPRLLAVLFVLIALPTCIILAVLVPPGQVADEPGQMARAAALVQGQWHGVRREVVDASGHAVPQSGVWVDPTLWHVAFVLLPSRGEKLDAATVAALRAMPWDGSRQFAEIGSIALYLPFFYIPAAIGLGAAELLRVAPYDAIVAGRLSAALCFVALGGLALTLARRGRALMFCALACPMTLSLAASFNQDGLLIAASALAAALASRAGPRCLLAAALLIGGVAAVKLPYLPLAALLLIAPGETWRRRALRVACVAAPALAWAAFSFATISAPVIRPPYRPGPLWGGDPAAVFTGTDPVAQFHVLLAAPARLLWLPIGTVLHDPWLLRQGIGILGWLDLQLPDQLYLAWMAALACAVLADMLSPRDPGMRWWHRPMLAGAALVTVWGIYISQYLAWTGIGFDRIGGPSGRYLLPLVPLVGLALPSLGGAWARKLRHAATAVPVLVAASGLIVLPAVIVGAYYLR